MKNTFFITFLCLFLGSCTQTIKDSLQEHKQSPEAIIERQRLKDELKSIKIDEQTVQRFLIVRQTLQTKRRESQEKQTSIPSNFVEKTIIENGFENQETFEKVSNKISVIAMYFISQKPEIREKLSKGKEELIKNIKDTSKNKEDSWVGNFIKEKIANNIDSLVKTGELIVNFSVEELEDLFSCANEEEKEAVKKNLEKISEDNLHVQL